MEPSSYILTCSSLVQVLRNYSLLTALLSLAAFVAERWLPKAFSGTCMQQCSVLASKANIFASLRTF